MPINRESFESIGQAYPNNVVLETPTGIVTNIDDEHYFSLSAHSMHGLTPALQSGLDYQFFTVEKRGKKKTDGLNDGALLHCLLLEKSKFNKRYLVTSDFDAIHSSNPLYFPTLDALRSFVTEHNKKAMVISKALKEAAKTYNGEMKTAAKQDTQLSYRELPLKYQDGKLSARTEKKLVTEFIARTYLPISTQESASTIKSKVAIVIAASQPFLGDIIPQEQLNSFNKAKFNTKAMSLNHVMDYLKTKFEKLSSEEQLALIPEQELIDGLSLSEKKRCISTYVKANKANTLVSFIDEKSDADTLYSELKAVSALPEIKEEIESKFFRKIFTIGGKKSDTEKYTVEEVLRDIEAKYNSAPILKSELEEQESNQATLENKQTISQKQFDHACRIIDTVLEHPRANALLTAPDNLYEHSIFWNETIEHHSLTTLNNEKNKEKNAPSAKRKVLCKLKADVMNISLNMISDIKFVSSVEFNKMSRDAATFHYHIQNAFYERGFNKLMSSHPEGAQHLLKFLLIVVEKDAPKLGDDESKPIRIRVVEYQVKDTSRGNKLVDAMMLEVEHWTAKNEFEGFNNIDSITVPIYQEKAEQAWLLNHQKKMAGHGSEIIESTSPLPSSKPEQQHEHKTDLQITMPSFAALREEHS